jgi:hypothetical protein
LMTRNGMWIPRMLFAEASLVVARPRLAVQMEL